MNLFEAVKDSVTARQAAELYGIHVGRSGMAVCPFHNDRNPSMKVDRRFHCFGCQADGDVIDFAARLIDFGKKVAAEKLAADFRAAPHNSARAICERFFVESRKKTEAILCVWQGLMTQSWRKRSAKRRRRHCAVLP